MLKIIMMKLYSRLWFSWKRLQSIISNKKYSLLIDIIPENVIDSYYCSFCEDKLTTCKCFSDIVQLFEKRKKEIALKIAQPIFDKVNNE